MKLSKVFFSVLLLACVLSISLVESSTSCSKPSQCGSNIKYKACDNKECTKCHHDSQCSTNKGDTCHADGHCYMSDFSITHLTIQEILAAVAVFAGSMIAAGGGLGGGGVFVPIFILIMGFDPKSAAALSQATIFGGSIVNLVMNFREQHPLRPHRTLADLPTVLMLAPLLLGGAVMGVILNEIMPDPVIVLLMIVLLAYGAFRTFRKGFRLWNKENLERKYNQNQSQNQSMLDSHHQQQQQQQQQSSRVTSGSDSMRGARAHESVTSLDKTAANDYTNEQLVYPNMRADRSTNHADNLYKPASSLMSGPTNTSAASGPMVIAESAQESNNFVNNNNYNFHNMNNVAQMSDASFASQAPWVFKVAKEAGQEAAYLQMKLNQRDLFNLSKLMQLEAQIWQPMLLIFLVWCIVSLFSLLRSTSVIITNLQCGSIYYWLIVIGIYPCLMVITALIARREVRNYQKKLMLYWMPCDGDIEWNASRAVMYPCIAMLAGLLGGLLGIGGGMIVSPLLFELGVLPRVAAATSAIAVMITASSSILQKYLENMIRTDWMIAYIVLGMVGTFVGQTMFNHFVAKYNRTSLVVFAVATIIGLAVVLMGIDGVLDSTWNFEFVPLC